MSDGVAKAGEPETVVFSEKLVSSAAFKTLFREGMALVEATAAYLDGPGRAESKALERNAALAYATESMRLTTRLMQLASWLLLQRAVNEGEMTPEQAGQEKNKVRLQASAAPDEEVVAMLPEALGALIEQSVHLHNRLRRLDEGAEPVPDAGNGVASQIDRLRQAFPGLRS